MKKVFKKIRSIKLPSSLLIFLAIFVVSIFGLQVSKMYAQTTSFLSSSLGVQEGANIGGPLTVSGGVGVGTGAPYRGLSVDGRGNFSGTVHGTTPVTSQRDALATVSYVESKISSIPACPTCPTCGWCSYCGDGHCDTYNPNNSYGGGLETCSNCPGDCGLCPCTSDYDCAADNKICCGQGTCSGAYGGPRCGTGYGYYDQIRTKEECLNCSGYWTASTGGCCDLYSCNYNIPYGEYYGEWQCNNRPVNGYNYGYPY